MRRTLALVIALCLPACQQQPEDGRVLLTKAALAAVERSVVTCTAATSAFGPLMARGKSEDLRYAAIDARNRCSIARAEIARSAGRGGALDSCRRSVDAQEQVALAELKALDDPADATRSAVVAALDGAIPLQEACGKAVAGMKADAS